MSQEAWAIVAATFLGPIFAVGITLWRDDVSRKYNRRLHVFRTLMATRKVPISHDHVNSINLIEVDFYKCKNVESAWKSYLSHLNDSGVPEDGAWREKKERLLAELLFQMGTVLKFDIPALDMFKGGYAPKGWEHRENRSNEMLEYLHKLSEGNGSFPIWLKGVTQPNPPQPPQ